MPKQFTTTLPVFMRKITFEKKNQLEEMLIEQIIEFELTEQGPLSGTYTPKLVIFMTTQKSLNGDLRVDYYLLLKYCKRQRISLPPTWAKSLTKFNTKMQDFQLTLDLNCNLKED